MASLFKDNAGNRTIQFLASDGKRRSIRLGKLTSKTAESLKIKVETLASSVAAKLPFDNETAVWVAGIGEDLAAKLANVGLLAPRRKNCSLIELLNMYFDEREAGNKPGTRTNHRTITNDLVRFFPATLDPGTLTAVHAKAFLAHLRERELASCTVARRIRRVQSIFAFAVKVGWLTRNPFADLKAPGTLPEERKAYVSAADTDRILAVASTVWRTIIALCRYAGLRCPSEVFRLKWEDVDFGSARMRVPSTKTVHQTGETHRSCSLFANLRPYLMEARQLSNSEAMYVVSGPLGDRIREKMDGPNGSNDANTRTEFLKIIKRAGLNPWPRLFHTLRASCETDLLAHLPMHAVAEWLGHSAAVALKHYARIPEGLYQLAANGRVTSGAVAGWSASAESSQFEAIEREDSAAKSGAVNVQNAVQSGSVGKEQEMTNATESLKNQASRRVLSPSVPPGTNTAMTPRRFELRSQP